MLLLLDRAFELLMKPAILHRAGRMMGTRNRGPAIGPQRSIRSATESQMSVPSAATFTSPRRSYGVLLRSRRSVTAIQPTVP
jgi:hypothetical protein